jgi:hypothetical protein
MDIEEWRREVLSPLIEGKEPVIHVDALGGLAILVADTDRTQDYVFESAKLPEIRGASRQLDDLNAQIAEMVGQAFDHECVIYTGGGSLLALVPANETVLDQLCHEIETLYPKETGVATITVDWRSIAPQMVLQGYFGGGFGGLVQWAGGWLRRRKEDKLPGPFVEALPHATRCLSCHTRPADPYVSFADWPLCKACKEKRAYKGRRAWFRRFQEFLDRHSKLRDEAYYKGYDRFPPFPSIRAEKESPPRWLPQDMSELGEASRARRGYIGLIHLDGDGFGGLFHQLPTPAHVSQFSKDIEEAALHAVMSALASHLHPVKVRASEARQEVDEEPAPGEPVWIHPFEILTIGGDDIWLIVPGDAAIPIAVAISTAFSERVFRPGEKKPCTLSGGVVIADDHNPVRILRDLAKQLARRAKRARQEVKADVGYIDFHIFKSADMLDRKISTLRRMYPYTLPAGEKSLRLLSRPYSADMLAEMWQQLQAMRAHSPPFPTSQMHQIAEALLRGRHESTLFYEYQRARDTHGHFERLDDALRTVQGDRTRDPKPWRNLKHDRYSHQTALWDIAEMYEFISSQKGGENVRD